MIAKHSIQNPQWHKTSLLTFRRQLKLIFHDGLSLLSAMVFLLLSVCVFHIAIGYHQMPSTTALGILLVCIIFALLMSCPVIIEEDYHDTTWEQLYLTGISLEIILLSKIAAQILCHCTFFILLIPLCFIILQLDWQLLPQFLLVTVLLVTLSTFNVMFAAAVSVGSKHRFLNAILVLPLAMPSVIVSILALHNPGFWLIMLALICLLAPVFTIAATLSLKQIFYYD